MQTFWVKQSCDLLTTPSDLLHQVDSSLLPFLLFYGAFGGSQCTCPWIMPKVSKVEALFVQQLSSVPQFPTQADFWGFYFLGTSII